MTVTAKLALEDGTVLTGTSIGADGEVDGEVCFNTSMTGYQEILTCLLYTSPSPRDKRQSRMPSSA